MSLGIWDCCPTTGNIETISDIFLPEHRMEHGSAIRLSMRFNGTTDFFSRLSRLSKAEGSIEMLETSERRYQPFSSRSLQSRVYQSMDSVPIRREAEIKKPGFEREQGAVNLLYNKRDFKTTAETDPWRLGRKDRTFLFGVDTPRAVHPTSSPTDTRTYNVATMPLVSQSLRSSVRCTRRGPRAAPQTFSRSASHGAPHFNEPTGFLFGEKVRPTPFSNPGHEISTFCLPGDDFSLQVRVINARERSGR